MILQITDSELQNFKGSLQLYYTGAVNDFILSLEPFITDNLQKQFKKEVEEARTALRDKLAKAPHLVII